MMLETALAKDLHQRNELPSDMKRHDTEKEKKPKQFSCCTRLF